MKHIIIFLFALLSFSVLASTNKESKEPDKAKIVFIGNSITQFWADKDSLFFANNGFINKGVSGETTIDILKRFKRDVIDLKPNAVVILAGINDIAENDGPISNEGILENIKSMVNLCTESGIRPILCSILPCDHFSWRPLINPAPRVKEMNTLIKNYASTQNIAYIDYYSKMANSQGGLDTSLAIDKCHPTREGYLIMEKIAIDTILKQFPNSNKSYYIGL